MPSNEEGNLLLRAARKAIADRLALPAPGLSDAERALPWLRAPRATFVTLTLAGELKGCIGSLVAHEPLLENLEEHACAAAFGDPRFPQLKASEFHRLRIEVSLLSPLETVPVRDEAEALAALRPGVDGVVLSEGVRRGTFLPQVWEELPEPAEFITHLKEKAGIPHDHWSGRMKLQRYTVEKFKET